MLLNGSVSHSPTIDEVAHLPAGLSHWQFGKFTLYRVNPPLVRLVAALPMIVACPNTDWTQFFGFPGTRDEFEIGRSFVTANSFRAMELWILARTVCVPFSILGAYVCYRWASELHGFLGGLLALTLWCFCPNILGHGQLITPDVAAAALGVGAWYSFWRWLKKPAWRSAGTASLMIGLALVTKFTWLILFVLCPVYWLIVEGTWTGGVRVRERFSRLVQLVAMLAVSVLVINVTYAFEGSFKRLGDYHFISGALGGGDKLRTETGNRFTDSWIAALPVPVPDNYLLGIDTQKRDFENRMWSYLRGEHRFGGWWYYYLYALAIKVPLGTWSLVLLAGGITLLTPRYGATWKDECALLLPPCVLLAIVSGQTGFNHHLRYVLPIFPFIFIWVGRLGQLELLKNWKVGTLVASGTVWSVGSSLWIYPHSLSYFNELVGGPTRGHEHLIDSNIDWGQDLIFLKRWLDRHPEARPLHFAYFGLFDPRVLGIDFTLPPRARRSPSSGGQESSSDEPGPQPGWFALSVNRLHGIRHVAAPDGNGGWKYAEPHDYQYFLRSSPVAMAGYSIYIYHFDSAEANRIRRELGLGELSDHTAANE
jgi:hypothetical protein